MRKKIAFLINSLEGGGAERVFTNLVNYLSDKDEYEIVVILIDNLEQKYEINSNIELKVIANSGNITKLELYKLYKELKQGDYDCVISFLTRANILNCICKKLIGYKSIISERVNTSTHLESGRFSDLKKRLISITYRLSDKIFAVSNGVKTELVDNFNIEKEKVEVIYNSIDIDRISALANNNSLVSDIDDFISSNTLVCVGRLVENKNFQLVIEAIKSLPNNLIIIGQGHLEPELRALVDENDLNDRVKFTGHMSNPFCVVQKCMAYVQTSNSEGFPNSLTEAMGLGIPVISTDCKSGPREILNPDCKDSTLFSQDVELSEYGILYPVNDVESLIKAIKIINTSPEILSRYSKLSTDRASTFKPNVIFDHYLNSIQEIIS
ncbi:glycosyltransferase [Vibrio sp. RC27]